MKGLQASQLVLREPQRAGGHVGDEVVRIASTRDGQHVRPAMQGPCQPDLRGRCAVRACNREDLLTIGVTLARLSAGTRDREERNERDALLITKQFSLATATITPSWARVFKNCW